MSVTPISPAEARAKYSLKTDRIVEALNIVICDYFQNGVVAFTEDQLLDVLSRTTGLQKQWLKSRNLDYNPALQQFRIKGWIVSYHSEVFVFIA